MKVTYRTEQLDFEIECDSMKDAFKKLSSLQEVFGDISAYYNGEKDDKVRFVVRENSDGDEFYELWYDGDNPKLFGCKKQFGVHKGKDGSLFPKYKDGEGNLLTENIYKNKGWTKWNKEKKALE